MKAQQPAYTYYTIRDGLPSNDIYTCTEDKRGFLWIATENGLAKFDGKNFQTYTTEQGLPDNEILDVQTDSTGKIWIIPFEQNPAYYDESHDRFVNSSVDPGLKKISFTTVNRCNPVINGIAFYNSRGGFFICRKNEVTAYKFSSPSLYPVSRVIQFTEKDFITLSYDSLRFWKNGTFKSSVPFGKNTLRTAFINGNLYTADASTLSKIKILPDGSTGRTEKITLPFDIISLNFTGRQLAVTSANGNVYLADTASLIFSQDAFSFNSLIRFVFEDRAGNTWICTKENGLICYRQKGILTISEPGFQRNFNALTFLNNTLVAGTNDGSLFYYSGPYNFREEQLNGKRNFNSWIRRLIAVEDRLYIASEGPVTDAKQKLNSALHFPVNANKDIFLVNDSILLAGTSAFAKIIHRRQNKVLDSLNLRVTALSAASSAELYIGSNDGLYKWGLNRKPEKLGDKDKLLRRRISSLSYNKNDNLLWVGLAADSLVILKNDRRIGIIPLGNNLPGNICRSLYSRKKGVAWLGTNKALIRINYSVINDTFAYSASVFTTADGLAGKQVNDITERNDTIYVATTAGISIIPAGLMYSSPDLRVYFTGIKINGADSVIAPEYKLRGTVRNISINFTTANLAAATERSYEYKINGAQWVRTQNENIVLQEPSPGKYLISVRAIKRDGQPSSVISEIRFSIATPFFRSYLFYSIVLLAAMALMFLFLQQQAARKREQSIRELLTEKRMSDMELKAIKAQINPHFIFNCLNSIKYLNHKKQFDETEKYLDKFSFLLRRTLDYSGVQKISLADEIEYSKTYLELEKLRLGNKLNYQFLVEPAIDAAETFIPPVLLQPYLENAIKHGIRYLKDASGLIMVRFSKNKAGLLCTITDNGIGISAAEKIVSGKNANHISQGLTLQDRRAGLYGISVSVEDANDFPGTVVTLFVENSYMR